MTNLIPCPTVVNVQVVWVHISSSGTEMTWPINWLITEEIVLSTTMMNHSLVYCCRCLLPLFMEFTVLTQNMFTKSVTSPCFVCCFMRMRLWLAASVDWTLVWWQTYGVSILHYRVECGKYVVRYFDTLFCFLRPCDVHATPDTGLELVHVCVFEIRILLSIKWGLTISSTIFGSCFLCVRTITRCVYSLALVQQLLFIACWLEYISSWYHCHKMGKEKVPWPHAQLNYSLQEFARWGKVSHLVPCLFKVILAAEDESGPKLYWSMHTILSAFEEERETDRHL